MLTSADIAQVQLNGIIEMISEKDKPVFFDTPVIVKTTPHTEIYRCYACVVNNDGNLMLMDADEQWNEVQPAQANASYVIASLYQRLKILSIA